MDIDIQSSIGDIMPDVKISKITLESSSVPEYYDNPHIESENENKDVYKANDNGNLKVTLDLVVRDMIQSKFETSWSTDEFFNKYLRLVVAQTDSKNAALILWNNFSTQNKRAFVQRVGQGVSKKLITTEIVSIHQDQTNQDKIRLLDKYKTTNSTGQAFYEFVYRVTFYVTDTSPANLSYFAYTLLDANQLAQDYELDLFMSDQGEIQGSNAIKGKLYDQMIGTLDGVQVFNNGDLKNTGKLFKTQEGLVWTGPIYLLPDKTYSGTPDGTSGEDAVPLNVTMVNNIKIQDFRARNKIFRQPLDLSYLDQKLFAPLKKIKQVGSENVVPVLNPTYVSSLMLAHRHGFGSNLLFSMDMESIVRNNSRFGAVLTTQFFNPINSFIEKSEILKLEIYRDQVDPNVSYKNEKGNTVYKLVDPDKPSKKIAFLHPTLGLGSNSIQLTDYNNINFDPDTPVGQEIGVQPAQPNIKHITLTDKNFFLGESQKGKFYQYRVAIEMLDGGVQHYQALYNDIVAAKFELDNYYSEALVPGNFDFQANKFIKKFTDKYKPVYQSVLTQLVAKTTWAIACLSVKGAQTEDQFTDYLKLAKLINTYINPSTATLDGINVLQNLVQEVTLVLEKILRIKSSTTSTNTTTASSPSSKVSKKKIKIEHTFSELFTHMDFDGSGYDFISPDKDSQASSGPVGLSVIPGELYEERIDKETKKYYSDTDIEISLNLGDGEDRSAGLSYTANTSDMKYAYLTPSIIKVGKSNYKLLEKGKLVFYPDWYIEMSTKIIQRNLPVETTLSEKLEHGLEDILASKNCTIVKAVSLTEKQIKPNKIGSPAPPDPTDADYIPEEAPGGPESEGPPSGGMTLFAGLISQDLLVNLVGDTEGIKKYDIKSIKNILATLDESLVSKLVTFETLPNQIKSLFAASVSNSTQTNQVINKMFFGDQDFTKDPKGAYMFFQNFRNIMQVEVFDGYEPAKDGTKRIFLSKPKFKLLTQDEYNSRRGQTVLCRMVKYSDSSFVQPLKDNLLDLPVYNETFMLAIPGELPSPPPPPMPDTLMEGELSAQTDDVTHMDALKVFPDPLEVAQQPISMIDLPSEPDTPGAGTTPKVGGGY